MFGRCLATIFLLAPLAATAAEPRGPYSISPVIDGFVRLDTSTGAMLYCRNYTGAIRCEEVGIDGSVARADEAEMDDLRNRIGALERKVTVLERHQIKLPNGQDVERTLDMMDRFMRRFMDSAREMDKEPTP